MTITQLQQILCSLQQEGKGNYIIIIPDYTWGDSECTSLLLDELDGTLTLTSGTKADSINITIFTEDGKMKHWNAT